MVIGLVQWTPYTKYTDWILPQDPSTMDNNLSRILYEVANNIQWGAGIYGTPPYSFYDFTQSTESAYNLAINFLKYYERPASLNYSRGTQAEYWFTFLGGISPAPIRKKTKFKWVLYANKLRNMGRREIIL